MKYNDPGALYMYTKVIYLKPNMFALSLRGNELQHVGLQIGNLRTCAKSTWLILYYFITMVYTVINVFQKRTEYSYVLLLCCRFVSLAQSVVCQM
jgi:hypothetical protein